MGKLHGQVMVVWLYGVTYSQEFLGIGRGEAKTMALTQTQGVKGPYTAQVLFEASQWQSQMISFSVNRLKTKSTQK